jgi:predicted DNA-binding protein
MHIRDTPEREDRIERLKEATGEKTIAKAVDAAMAHYVEDLENKQRVAEELPNGLAEDLSTPWLPIERSTNVGRSD